jgi:hypothetical protein
MKNLAQGTIPIAPNGGFKGYGPLGLEGAAGAVSSDYLLQTFISSVIGIISIVAIIWFVFVLISGGISYLSSGADKNAVEGARKKITNGLIGLLITLFGIFILNLAGQIFGIPDILNIVGMLNVITTP